MNGVHRTPRQLFNETNTNYYLKLAVNDAMWSRGGRRVASPNYAQMSLLGLDTLRTFTRTKQVQRSEDCSESWLWLDTDAVYRDDTVPAS
ncbi:hypothetical protein J6590_003325 [Homalodisca vitripennis]|nr:hypothetical protein J6590_003325 [Homalodisca vitripennis]